MKLTIHYHDCDYPIDLDDPHGHEYRLDDMLDSFQPNEVREVINQNLDLFRGLCDIWNQRELAQRRALESPPLQAGARVTITNPAFVERGRAGTLEIEDGCWAIRFEDGTALGVGETDVQRAEEA